ncbi:RAQPRD family integrative conjugative element protein [Pseudomonas aeruginosa]|uniref:integrative conjugative element protein, RAQPRD family n=1 Tax=Pseudomonas aeruginosa TaxID=287 RepID=UPI000F7F0B92|nr:RAQPRD family integrative conjugative element protein [Pseudomonas aeruginosa]RTB44128.1 hypothetical protein EJ655_08300 [Pseudomonas aeruginosa]
MSSAIFSSCVARRIPALALAAVLAVPACAWASQQEIEQTQLALIQRQLDQLDRTVAQAAAIRSAHVHARYTFDYRRLSDDLARIRAGVGSFLAPSRAQPRDAAEIDGGYRLDAESEAVE